MSNCHDCGHPNYFHDHSDSCDYDTDYGRCTCSGYIGD